MTAPQYDDVTDTELSILDLLWSDGPSTIRQLAARLYPEGKTSEYATVQSLLLRLESKGYVARDRRSFAHVFRATVERSAIIGISTAASLGRLVIAPWFSTLPPKLNVRTSETCVR